MVGFADGYAGRGLDGADRMISQEVIESKQKILLEVGSRLKEDFVGLDAIIDSIIEAMTSWYIMPELQTRPLIINLWGLTGVGKTDLVRKLVKYLKYQESYLEVQLSSMGNMSSYHKTFSSFLHCSSLEDSKPGVLLLDEFQRFKTISEEGKEILSDRQFEDLWQLFSDGHFSMESQIKEFLLENYYYLTLQQEELPDAPKNSKKPTIDLWTAKRLKRYLRLPETPLELVTKAKDEIKVIFENALDHPELLYVEEDYTKLLIFVSGNLDEAYNMAGMVGDADIDPDIFHKHSKKISVVEIKKALMERYRPEQISRLGNTHIIYPSLSSATYRELIERTLKKLAVSVNDKYEVAFEFDKSVFEFVFKNGVFATQGVRPVFSTIVNCIEAKVPALILECIKTNKKTLCLSIVEKESQFHLNGIKISAPLEDLRNQKTDEERQYVSVHEAGHLMASLFMLGEVPLQATARTTNGHSLGFIISDPDDKVLTKEQAKAHIGLYLGGRAAEVLVFGPDKVSTGVSSDLDKATSIAVRMQRAYGMGEYVGTVESPEILSNPNWSRWIMHVDTKKMDVNGLLQEELSAGVKLLSEKKAMFLEVVDLLSTKPAIYEEEILSLVKKYKYVLPAKPGFINDKVKFFE